MITSLKCLARPVVVCLCVLTAIPAAAAAQGGRGTIAGTVCDPAGAVIPAENQCNGVAYRAGSTRTGRSND
ncbi:MAG: hypothetical protein H6Q04_3517 [Acidobacteria bacterium]|nr:hypothetical protein [Acidobacteriota bacterium]